MPRNILTLSHLYPSPALPHMATFVRDEVVELARRNHMLVVAPIRGARGVPDVPGEAEEDGIRIVRPRFPGIPIGGRIIEPRLWASRLRPLLHGLYEELDGDLVHAHFALPDGFAAAHFAARENVPLVLTVRGSDVFVLGRRRIARGDLRRTLERIQALIAVSDELAERAAELGMPRERIHVIPGGVPYLSREDRQEARRRLGLDEDAVCILWVGRLVSVKQPLDAIRAFAALANAALERDIVLVMIGEGPLHARSAETSLDSRGSTVACGSSATGAVTTSGAGNARPTSRSTPVARRERPSPSSKRSARARPSLHIPCREYGPRWIGRRRNARSRVDARGSCRRDLSGAGPHRADRHTLADAARNQYDITRAGREIEDVYEAVL